MRIAERGGQVALGHAVTEQGARGGIGPDDATVLIQQDQRVVERFQNLFVGFQTVPQPIVPLHPIAMNPRHSGRQQARGRRRVGRETQAVFRFLQGLDVRCDRCHIAPVDSSRQQTRRHRREDAYDGGPDRDHA